MDPIELVDLSDSFLGKLVIDLLEVAIVGPVRDLFGETVGLLLAASLLVALPIILTIVFYKMMLRWGQFFSIRMAYPALIGWLALGVFGGGMGRLLGLSPNPPKDVLGDSP